MECKRIPSARISCEAFNQIHANPCLYKTSEFPPLRVLRRSPAELESIIKSIRERWAEIPQRSLSKWIGQICHGDRYLIFTCIAQWGSRSEYYFGHGYYHETRERPAIPLCLYFGKSRIHSKRVRGLLGMKRFRGIIPRLGVLGPMPWELWDDPEYHTYWKRIQRRRLRVQHGLDGQLQYWDDQLDFKEISQERQKGYKKLDALAKEINKAYTLCLTTEMMSGR